MTCQRVTATIVRMDSSPISGDFQQAVVEVTKASSAVYDATFETIAECHGVLAGSMVRMMSFSPRIQKAVDEWYWADDDSDYPEPENAHEEALMNAYIEFLSMRDADDRVMGYAHHYNEFSNSLGDLISFCADYDSDIGGIRQ